MSKGRVNLKVKLPVNLIQQIQGVSDEQVDKIIQDAISHYIATYASETVISESVTKYLASTEDLFEKNFDKLTNLMASLSYVSKFNNNILNAIFINNGGKEDDLERLYNEATDTVQKYFYFEENEGEVLPIMEENDQLKLKVQSLKKAQSGNNKPQASVGQPKPEDIDASVKTPKDQAYRLQKQTQTLEEQKKELVEWINGLILHVVQNYSHFHKNEKLLREYIDKHPKPKI